MKADKNLKKIIKKSQRRRTDMAFRQSVFDQNCAVCEKPAIKFYKSAWFRASLSAACCMAIIVGVLFGAFHGKNQPQIEAEVIVMEQYDSAAVAFNKNGGDMLKKADKASLTVDYTDKKINFEGYNIDEDSLYCNKESGVAEYRYIYGSKESNLFQVQIVLNGRFEYDSQLTSCVKQTNINGIRFDYSVYWAMNDKMYYIFGESKSENGAMLVGFVTTRSDYEAHFKSFLLDIIE